MISSKREAHEAKRSLVMTLPRVTHAPPVSMPTARTDTWHRHPLFLQVIHAALARASSADVADDDKVHASTVACALLNGCLCLLNGCLC